METPRNAALKNPLLILMALALLLSGAIAGFFYAYSSSVMRGLDAAPPADAIAAMQGINAQVRNAIFAPAFFGTPIVCGLAGILLLISGLRAAGIVMTLAAVVYLGGAFLPTFAVNVPMNEALALTKIPADEATAQALWTDYSTKWTWWNHLRAIFSFFSVILVGASIYLAGQA